MTCRMYGFLGRVALACVLCAMAGGTVRGDVLLDFHEIAPGTLVQFSPYENQGFVLTADSGGFLFNSVDTGNGSAQTPGDNPYYAGANALAAFSPATITLARTDGSAFSLRSIDLARNFMWDLAPSVTFVGVLDGGGTVSETVTVSLASPPPAFETFAPAGFTNILSLSWTQGVGNEGIHQFTNILLGPATVVPEPSTLAIVALALPLGLVFKPRRRTS